MPDSPPVRTRSGRTIKPVVTYGQLVNLTDSNPALHKKTKAVIKHGEENEQPATVSAPVVSFYLSIVFISLLVSLDIL